MSPYDSTEITGRDACQSYCGQSGVQLCKLLSCLMGLRVKIKSAQALHRVQVQSLQAGTLWSWLLIAELTCMCYTHLMHNGQATLCSLILCSLPSQK